MRRRSGVLVGFIALALAACSGDRSVTAPEATGLQPDILSLHRAADPGLDLRKGAVFAMTNQASGNAIAAFARSADGSLTFVGNFPTGGSGAGTQPDALRSQGSLILGSASDEDDHMEEKGDLLFAVNAGSNEISVLRVERNGLTLVSKVSSEGIRPTSLTVHGRLLYVLNAGSGTVNGFRLTGKGQLKPINRSARPISGGSTADPSEVSFSPDGRLVAVTGKSLNNIDTYLVDEDGRLVGPKMNPSNGPTPFGFAFDDRRHMVVAEASGNFPTLGAASSYSVSRSGDLRVISGSVHNAQAATSWLVISNDGQFVYVSNTGSADISSYRLSRDGTLTLIDPAAGSTEMGSMPADEALAANGRYLYVRNDAVGTINSFRVEQNGSLTWIASTPGLPPNAQGLAAR